MSKLNMDALFALAGVDVTSSDAFLPNGEKNGVKILNEGEPENILHKHHMEYIPWDRDKLGIDVIDIKGDFATYLTHRRCSCGREVIVSQRALR
ncbi:hypothetical protein A2V49_01530 [candidate division WWE3 bacterium RBG_19FT_COMBO_34_6]|uniref:Uncharacterized protein n=1 Tax=candidate division WWE3 bacterium RBG_19FT_COMBO_34_6 TaxID=1802612 RepID=A0A1F4UK74_UNCKA|nr:MAG: hypothetical protein A2V49_01530 [candidate division WWE3 bacterium RBG_19FT_COMBO_34_6]